MTADLSMNLFAAGLLEESPVWHQFKTKRVAWDLRTLERMSIGEMLFAVLAEPAAKEM